MNNVFNLKKMITINTGFDFNNNNFPIQNKNNEYPFINYQIYGTAFLTTSKIKKYIPFPQNITPKEIFSQNNYCLNTINKNIQTNQALILSNFSEKSKLSIPKIIYRKTLILDIDETLVHSGFYPFNRYPDITLNIKLNGLDKDIYVLKRPHVDEFLKELSNIFEIITFTASISQYASPLLDKLDTNHFVTHRLFRENCIYEKGVYIKDLRNIGRELKNVIIIDNNPASYLKNEDNGIPILTWYDDINDNELMKLIPLLKYLANIDDVRPVIRRIVDRTNNRIDFNIVNEIIEGNNNINYTNYIEKDHNNKEINYTMIKSKITNSLSNMSYNEFFTKPEKKITNFIKPIIKKLTNNTKKNMDKINNENNIINNINTLKKKIIKEYKSNKNIKKKSTNKNIINNENKSKADTENMNKKNFNNTKNKNNNDNHHINEINKTNSNLDINNEKKNMTAKKKRNKKKLSIIDKIIYNNNDFNNDLNNDLNNNLNNKSHKIYNQISFNNYFTKEINNIESNQDSSFISKDFPEDNSKSKEIFHPRDSGSPKDSNRKKSLKYLKLMKYNNYKNISEKIKNNNNLDIRNNKTNINKSLTNEVFIHNINSKNEMFLLKIKKNRTPKKERKKKSIVPKSKEAITEGLKGKQKFIKKVNSIKIIKYKKNNLKLNKKVKENEEINNENNIKNNKIYKIKEIKLKLDKEFKTQKKDDNIDNNNNNYINALNNNKQFKKNITIKKTKKINNNNSRNKSRKNKSSKNNGYILNERNNFDRKENIDNIKFNKSNENICQIIYQDNIFENKNFKDKANSPFPTLYKQININYKKIYDKPNVDNENAKINYLDLKNKKYIFNKSQYDFYSGGSLNVLYRNNLMDLKNNIFSNLELYSDKYINNYESSYI